MGHGEAISPEGTADSVSQIHFSLAYAMLLSKAKLLLERSPSKAKVETKLSRFDLKVRHDFLEYLDLLGR